MEHCDATREPFVLAPRRADRDAAAGSLTPTTEKPALRAHIDRIKTNHIMLGDLIGHLEGKLRELTDLPEYKYYPREAPGEPNALTALYELGEQGDDLVGRLQNLLDGLRPVL